MKIGYSDHSSDLLTPVIAASKNIDVIEVHVTKSIHYKVQIIKVHFNIRNFSKYVKLIRKSEIILGSHNKKITKSEQKNYKHVTKRLFMRKDILADQILQDCHIACKRSNSGLLASEYHKIINKKVNKNIKKDSRILLRDLK